MIAPDLCQTKKRRAHAAGQCEGSDRRRFLKHAFGVLPFLFSTVSAEAASGYRWLQYVPGGLEARAITQGAACPPATVNGHAATMQIRAKPGPGYPVLVCALRLPAGTAAASIDGAPLPLPKPEPSRILLIGDTGCRLLGRRAQPCNDEAAWPFPAGSKIAAAIKPDLVIHVGDYHYRESACPAASAGCAGSPHGDTFDVWREDFFAPASPLLAAAPWVFARGNHEECDRGGKGWSRALDPYAFAGPGGCLRPGQPFSVSLGGVSLYVMDVATANEGTASKTQAARFARQFAGAARLGPKPVWIAMHRPVWAAAGAIFGYVEGDNKTLALAARASLPANVQAILSGHIHTFAAMDYVEDLPLQIISGHGGDELHPFAPASFAGLKINGVTVKSGIGAPGMFGFAMLEKNAAGWTLTNYDFSGNAQASCKIQGRALACGAP